MGSISEAMTSSSVTKSASNYTKSSSKWSGGVDLVLNCNLDAAWSLQSDFMGLPSWVPTISVSRLLEGEANAVGCLRYCKGSGTTWVHERLLELDHANHFMSYRMEDNHFVFPHGFQGYVAKVQLGEAGEGQTWVRWNYEVDPVVTETRGHLTKFMIDFYTANLKYLEAGANQLEASLNRDNSAAADAASALATRCLQPLKPHDSILPGIASL